MYYPSISLEALKKTTKKTSITIAVRRSRESNPEPPAYEVGVLITRPRRLLPRYHAVLKVCLITRSNVAILSQEMTKHARSAKTFFKKSATVDDIEIGIREI
jgi:hypothetical protein